MNNFLITATVVFGIVMLLGYLNERFFHLTYEISLLLGAIAVGGVLTLLHNVFTGPVMNDIVNTVQILDVERFLMKGVLCFMLFAGACHMDLSQFHKHARPVCVLSFVVTGLGAVFYAFAFYAVSLIFGLSFSIPECLMFGSIIAPTDPIAATSILKKFGFPKDTGFLMEAESLLNDGVGVALFVVFSGLVTSSSTAEGTLFKVLLEDTLGLNGLFMIMIREILGALIICSIVFGITFFIFGRLENENLQIMVSLFAVSCIFCLCEFVGCSGPIACVVYGVLFFSMRGRRERQGKKWDLEGFDKFWESIDSILNSTLYVMLGLSFIKIHVMPGVGLFSMCAVFCALISRFVSVWIGAQMLGPIPDKYSKNEFSVLFTWGGLHGGLCIALAMDTASMIEPEKFYIVMACTYAVVFFTTVVQGLTMKKVYNSMNKAKLKNAG